jgi:hypothetical protein
METIRDEQSAVSPFDLIGPGKAVLWLVFFSISLFLSLMFVFGPPNTSFTQTRSSTPLATSLRAITDRAQITGFSSLSSFLIVWVRPTASTNGRDLTGLNITVTAYFDTLSEALEPLKPTETVQGQYLINCYDAKCDPIRIYELTWITFYGLSLTATIETEAPILESISFEILCHSQIIAVVAFVIISIFTILSALIFLISVSRRMRPIKTDQWATVWLGTGLILIDGPWLILKYYTSQVASQLFDLSPELFHAFFIVYLTIFIAERSVRLSNHIFSSWWIRGTFLAASAVLVIIQFCATKLMPLCTLSIFITESLLKYPIFVFSGILHLAIVLFLGFGVVSVQIEQFMLLIVAGVAFFLLEAIYIVKMYVRFFISVESIGVAFAADFLYILMANIVAIFFLQVNLPVRPSFAAAKAAPEAEVGLRDDVGAPLDPEQDGE